MSTTERVFRLIADCANPIGGDDIGATLGISRAAVFKHIQKLRESGVKILSSKAGYLYEKTDTLTPYTLSYRLHGLGVDIFCKTETCDSTNNAAKRESLLRDSDFLIAAPIQTGGRGRLGRGFESGLGGAYFSLCRHPRGLYASDGLKTVLMCAVAVAEELESLGFEPSIKWPNDVFLKGRKVCGILVESNVSGETVDEIIFGIGINVNNTFSDALTETAVSLSEIGGAAIERERVIAGVAARLLRLLDQYEKEGFGDIEARYIARSQSVGRDVCVKQGDTEVKGRAVGLSEEGFLLVDDGKNVIRIVAGDVGL